MRELKIKIPVEGQEVVFDAEKELYIDSDATISEHMKTIASDIAYWNALYALMLRNKASVTNDYDMWLAQAKSALPPGVYKSETAKEEQVMVVNVQAYMEWRKKVIDAEYHVNLLKESICAALEAKKFMLSSLGAQLRAEIFGGVTSFPEGTHKNVNDGIDAKITKVIGEQK